MGGELYHGEDDVHEVFAVVVALIYIERRFSIELTLSYFARPIWDWRLP